MIYCHHEDGGDCHQVATHRYTWPGQHEAAMCDPHFHELLNVATDLGIDIVHAPLTLADHANPVHPLTIKVPK